MDKSLDQISESVQTIVEKAATTPSMKLLTQEEIVVALHSIEERLQRIETALNLPHP
jgi:hypothetical protein